MRAAVSKLLTIPLSELVREQGLGGKAKLPKRLQYPLIVKSLTYESSTGISQASVVANDEQLAKRVQFIHETIMTPAIVEEFIEFDSEITLLTVATEAGVLFCSPIGHRQEAGDYRESWQPAGISDGALLSARRQARKVVEALGGYGIFGVEFFVKGDQAIFSELSPRPHDTGMVTMGTQVWSQFALHARAILGLPIVSIRRHSAGASVALRAESDLASPKLEGLTSAYTTPNVDVRFFGKPSAGPRRRLGVVLATGDTADVALATAKQVAGELRLRDA